MSLENKPNNNQNKPVEKIARRGFLKGAVGVVAATIAGGLASRQVKETNNYFKADTKEKIDKYVDEGPLTKIEKFKKSFEVDRKFFERANTQVIGVKENISRVNYAQDSFLNFKAKKMPPSFQAKMAVLVPGILAQETRYDPTVVSSAGATGIIQALPALVYDINKIRTKQNKLPFDLQDMSKMINAMEFFYTAMDEVFYTAISVPAYKIGKDYGLDHEQAENFSVYCTINAYNTGPTRMRNVLASFFRAFEPNETKKEFSYSSLSLFGALVAWAKQIKAVDGYREQSADYVFKVIAGTEILGYENLEGKYFAKKLSAEFAGVLDDLVGSAAVLGTGAAVTTAGTVAERVSSTRDITKASLSKRQFFSLGALGAAAALGTNYSLDNPDKVKKASEVAIKKIKDLPRDFSWWREKGAKKA